MPTNPFLDQPQAAHPRNLSPGSSNPDASRPPSQGLASLGMGLMSMDDSDDEDERAPPSRVLGRSPPPPAHPQVQHTPVPLAAPRPGYAAQASQLTRPPPSATPDMRARTPEMSQVGSGPVSGGARPGTLSRTPSTDPHPLRPPMTPIQPVFARPAPAVQFTEQKPIMRAQTENVVPGRDAGRGGRGGGGDDFWRRFSMVIKEESAKKPGEKRSRWLVKTQGGTQRLSRWVWCIGLVFLLLIVGISVLGWWVNHNNQKDTKSAPETFGTSEKHSAGAAGTTPVAVGTAGKSSTAFHVTPTNTVARRVAFDATPTGAVVIPDAAVVKRHVHARRHLNRSNNLD